MEVPTGSRAGHTFPSGHQGTRGATQALLCRHGHWGRRRVTDKGQSQAKGETGRQRPGTSLQGREGGQGRPGSQHQPSSAQTPHSYAHFPTRLSG